MEDGETRRPWKTWPITILVFLPFFVYGFKVASRELSWGGGFEVQFAMVFQAIGTGLLPGFIAAAICIIHNRGLRGQ